MDSAEVREWALMNIALQKCSDHPVLEEWEDYRTYILDDVLVAHLCAR